MCKIENAYYRLSHKQYFFLNVRKKQFCLISKVFLEVSFFTFSRSFQLFLECEQFLMQQRERERKWSMLDFIPTKIEFELLF